MIPRAPRSKGSLTPKHISESFPTLSINFASVYILSTCVLSTLPSDRRDIEVAFLIYFCNVSIYVSIIMDNNYLSVRYCKSTFVIILSLQLYLNVNAIIFTTALTRRRKNIQVKPTSLQHNTT